LGKIDYRKYLGEGLGVNRSTMSIILIGITIIILNNKKEKREVMGSMELSINNKSRGRRANTGGRRWGSGLLVWGGCDG
jgi:hypothetical protein